MQFFETNDKIILRSFWHFLLGNQRKKHMRNCYYKCFKTYTHLVAIIFPFLSWSSSLREVSIFMIAYKGKIDLLTFKLVIVLSTLSNMNKKRSSREFAVLNHIYNIEDGIPLMKNYAFWYVCISKINVPSNACTKTRVNDIGRITVDRHFSGNGWPRDPNSRFINCAEIRYRQRISLTATFSECDREPFSKTTRHPEHVVPGIRVFF